MNLLPSVDLWRDPGYRRLWLAVLLSAFADQITSLALALTSAQLLQATPLQVGRLGAMWALPFMLLSMPCGVWLDRVPKLPVYVAGEGLMAFILLAVPLAWLGGWLSMDLLYGVAFCLGSISVVAGTAAQIVFTQVVAKARLVEAHARKGMATTLAEVAGPGIAGVLIKLWGPVLTLFGSGLLYLGSVFLLRPIRVEEQRSERAPPPFWAGLWEGLRFVAGTPLLRLLALAVAGWQLCQTSAMVVQVLYATRELGLSEYQYGLCYSLAALGTLGASLVVSRLSRRIGPGPCLILGMAVSGGGWLQQALVADAGLGVVAFILMLMTFSTGTVLIFSNLLALRQAITPPALLGRMTATMRFMTLLPAGPGALLGGYLAEQLGYRPVMAIGGTTALLLAIGLWQFSPLRRLRQLP